MHRLARFVAALGVALAFAFTGQAAGAPLAAAGPAVVGHVYVNDNTSGTNTIAGFDRYADGTLAPLPGSPFSAGGAGLGAVTGVQGALQISSDGRYLLAVDAGSNQISVLRILPNGTLRLAEGSPIWSGGVEPLSIAVHGSLVYVANAGDAEGRASYTGFTLNPSGLLTPLAGSKFKLPVGYGPGDIFFNADGTRLAATRVNTSLIDSFVVDDGRLTPAPGSPYAAQAPGPFGSAFRPTNPDQVFVSNAHAGVTLGTISAYTDGADGTLTPIGASPYADNQTAPCWLTITRDGQYLFAVNTGSTAISSFSIGQDGTLSLLGSTTLKDASGLRPFDIGVDGTGSFAYVVDAGTGKVSALANSGGTLTELSASPLALPAGATPFGIVVD